jgi:hypothetical protein
VKTRFVGERLEGNSVILGVRLIASGDRYAVPGAQQLWRKRPGKFF